MVGNLAFSELWGLKELMLDNNAIEYISERAFGGLTQLRKLTLSGNKLTTFYEDILEDIRSLVVLDLRYNMLEVISYETVRPVVENDKSASTAVYLEGNPLSCNCRLSWIYALRNETQDSTLRNALEKVSCVTDLTQSVTADRHLNDQEDKEIAKDNTLTDDTYDYYDKNEDYTERKFTKKATKLTDIPLETLPCPKELMQTEEYGHPVQNEIRLKAFSSVEKISPCLVLVLIMLLC
ncbi:hypothetical protein PYW07_012398 [Mythimna separata]|uniref:Connectin n=1 Tax=Mythimna separata TaxID=271217 RepID=A0AAD7YNA3_MYTSE|nr:hypothetical protein PYW07_012398 [Mythimna separata]